MTSDKFLLDTERTSDPADLILEKHTERLHNLQVHLFRKTTHIMMGLDLRSDTRNAGRLDYDSEGLLIMTNDGDLAYKITHPKFVMDKTYHAIVDGELTQAQRSTLEHGVALDDGFTTSPARISNTHKLKNGNSSFDITIHEGHNRQVRRMLSAVGRETLLLRRVKIGPIELGNLGSGKWRYLTPDELAAFEYELNGDK